MVCPKGVSIVPVYDRSDLIYRAIDTLSAPLVEEKHHHRIGVSDFSAARAQRACRHHHVANRRVARFHAFMHAIGISSNIMSLGGIAIAIARWSTLAIVMIENAHKHWSAPGPDESRISVLIKAATEVGPALFFRLVGHHRVVPSRIHVGGAGKGDSLNHWSITYTFSLAAAALLSITLVPGVDDAVRSWTHHARAEKPREPRFNLGVSTGHRCGVAPSQVDHRCCAGRVAISIYPVTRIGSEFMPDAKRRHVAFYARQSAEHVHNQGGRTHSTTRQDHKKFPRSRIRCSGKSGTC